MYLPVSGCKIKDPVTFCGIYIIDLLDCMLTYRLTRITYEIKIDRESVQNREIIVYIIPYYFDKDKEQL